jgi:hypothetical protein
MIQPPPPSLPPSGSVPCAHPPCHRAGSVSSGFHSQQKFKQQQQQESLYPSQQLQQQQYQQQQLQQHYQLQLLQEYDAPSYRATERDMTAGVPIGSMMGRNGEAMFDTNISMGMGMNTGRVTAASTGTSSRLFTHALVCSRYSLETTEWMVEAMTIRYHHHSISSLRNRFSIYNNNSSSSNNNILPTMLATSCC